MKIHRNDRGIQKGVGDERKNTMSSSEKPCKDRGENENSISGPSGNSIKLPNSILGSISGQTINITINYGDNRRS